MEWMPIDTAPECKNVLVSCLNQFGKQQVLIAYKAGDRNIELDPDEHCCLPSEQECWCIEDCGVCYAPAGTWFEYNLGGETHYLLTGVEGWQELPRPKQKEASGQ